MVSAFPQILKKDAKFFDIFSVIVLMLGLFFSIFLTKIDIYFISYALPLILLLKTLVYKADFLELLGLSPGKGLFGFLKKDNKVTNDAILLVHVIFFAIIPIFADYFNKALLVERGSHWLNAHNSYWIILFYVSALYIVNVGKTIFKKVDYLKIATVTLLFSSFLIDFCYGAFKAVNHLNKFTRWEGSANNPNTWAVQASLILILMIAADHLFFDTSSSKGAKAENNHIKKIIFYMLIFVPFMGIYFSASLGNTLGMFSALLAIIVPSSIYYLFFVYIIGIFTFNLYILFGDVMIVKSLGIFGKKLIPRLKLWQYIPDYVSYESFNWLLGSGVEKYREWTTAIDPRGSDHIHNSYYHNLLLYGLPGLYFAYSYLFLLKEDLLKVFFNKKVKAKVIADFVDDNKFYFAIIFFVLTVSCFDCSFFFYENQILFWSMIPVLKLIQD